MAASPALSDADAAEQVPDHPFDLSGGRLCLDLTNTLSGRGRERPREYLVTYADLLRWGLATGLLDAAGSERLAAEAARNPAQAHAVLCRARSLREAIYGLFEAVVTARSPAPADLDLLNAELATALSHACLTPSAGRLVWDWAAPDGALDVVLWSVARSAAEIVTTDDLRLVRICADDTCRWLFVDTTRNRSRQWCDMKVCGNRAKARRHYQKRRQAPGE